MKPGVLSRRVTGSAMRLPREPDPLSRAASGLLSIPRPEAGGIRKAVWAVALVGVFGRVVIAANTLWGDESIAESCRD